MISFSIISSLVQDHILHLVVLPFQPPLLWKSSSWHCITLLNMKNTGQLLYIMFINWGFSHDSIQVMQSHAKYALRLSHLEAHSALCSSLVMFILIAVRCVAWCLYVVGTLFTTLTNKQLVGRQCKTTGCNNYWWSSLSKALPQWL